MDFMNLCCSAQVPQVFVQLTFNPPQKVVRIPPLLALHCLEF